VVHREVGLWMQTSPNETVSDTDRSVVRDAVLDTFAKRAKAGKRGPFAVDRLFRESCDKLVDAHIIPPRLDRSHFMDLNPDQRDHHPDFGAPTHIARFVRQVLWELYLQGILAPASARERPERESHGRAPHSAPPFSCLYLDYCVLTQYGLDILTDTTNRIQVHDPDGYLANFLNADPQPDPEMMRYLEECVSVFRGGHFLATIVLLGIASERLIEVLAENLRDTLGDPRGTEWFEKRYRNRRDISARFKALSATLMGEYADGLNREKLKDAFNGVVTLTFDQIRNARNDIAHPSGREFTWNEVSGFLHNYVQYFIYANRTIAFLRVIQKTG